MEYDPGMSDYRAERGRYRSIRDTGHFGVGTPSVSWRSTTWCSGRSGILAVGEDLIECFDAIDNVE